MAEGFLHDFEGWAIFMACTAVLVAEMWVLACAVLVGFLKLAPTTGWRLHDRSREPGTAVTPAWIQWLRRDQRLLKGAFYAAMLAIPAASVRR
jgi:hypothetical protein